MNIFMVDSDPYVAAQCLCDKHVVKMILESAQMLSTAHRVLDGDKEGNLSDANYDLALYNITHKNHPCSKWVRESRYNYDWLYYHMDALIGEYHFRYEKTHKCFSLITPLYKFPENIDRRTGPSDLPPCMPEEYKVPDDTISSYRNYYRHGKAHLLKWKKRSPPEWI